jgi:predicted phage terminase large subunit-like protein
LTSPNVEQLQQYTELLEELARRQRLEKFKTDILAFGKYYLNERIFTSESPQFHRDLVDLVQEALFDREKGHFIAIAAPRSHAKSMVVTVTSTLWAILHGYHYIVIISSKQELAKILLDTIKNELETNEKLIEDYGPQYSSQVWNAMAIVTANGCRVQAVGAGDRLRGFNFNGYRPEIVILDDLENDEDVLNAAYRDRMHQWINSAVIPLGTPGKTHFLYVGTLLHEDSVLRRIMKDDPRFKSVVFSAIQKFPERMDLWDRWGEMLFERVIDENGQEESAFKSAQRARQFYEENKEEMERGAVVLWPSRMSLYDLMVIRYTQRRTFQTEYQQTPRDDSTAVFTQFTFYDELPPLDEMDIYGAVDPSLGKSKRADPSCIVTIGYHRKTGVIYVIDVNTKRRSPDAIIEDILRLATVYKYKQFAVEAVAFQEFFKTQLMTRAQLAGIYLPVKPVKPLSDKNLRISGLEPLITNKFIRFARHHVGIIEEFRDFPSSTHDDQMDALQMATELIYTKKGSFVFDAI